MDDEGQAGVEGERNLRGEDLALHVAGRVVVVIVEPTFAHRDDLGAAEEGGETVDAFLGVVRVDAGRGPHAVELASDVSGDLRAGHVGPDVDAPVDTRGGRLSHPGRGLDGIRGQMAMRVGPAVHARRTPLITRG